MRIIKGLAPVFAVIFIIAIGSFFYLRSVHSPNTPSEVQLTGLNSEATVHFDDYGIPHIYAENNIDAWRTLGYVHARDRLFQMDVLRRVGAGRLSELFGDDVMKHLSINSRFDINFSFLSLFKNSLDTESIYHEQILILFSLQ